MIRRAVLAGLFLTAICCLSGRANAASPSAVGLWRKFEYSMVSAKSYDNPLYDVRSLTVRFTAPGGRVRKVSGFWDGGTDWKVRFMPDETGTWTFETACSDTLNPGLHGVIGSFVCTAPGKGPDIFTRGAITRARGAYHLMHADGTPFFWLGDTAWNGAIRAADEEWERYLEFRAGQGYSVIQFIATQWRGCIADPEGRVAFEGSGRIRVNPDFFRRLDRRIDRLNELGFVAAPGLLWALQRGPGRELNPGYYLPEPEAVLLARYMVARWGGNHVVWLLGGDGRYIDEYEQRWKTIGRGVFGDEHPGLTSLHPMGGSWIGNAYAGESWLDIVGYQSSHGLGKPTIEFITRGPAAREWAAIPARPVLNMEPIYENIFRNMSERDVRTACWWSIMATPISGVTYGANGVWPWLRTGEKILNHTDAPHTLPWEESLALPGGGQAAQLAAFMRKLEWWRLRPAPELLAVQPGDIDFRQFISVAADDNRGTILIYTPVRATVSLYNPRGDRYRGRWFDPVAAKYQTAALTAREGRLEATPPGDGDWTLLLEKQ